MARKMDIKEDHKKLLKELGLVEGDFELFDGKFVTYEYDERKGVRLYDPYYRTSYNEYIDVSGWSSWSSERDTFMSDILKGAKRKAQEREKISPKPSREEFAQDIKRRFGKPIKNDSRE